MSPFVFPGVVELVDTRKQNRESAAMSKDQSRPRGPASRVDHAGAPRKTFLLIGVAGGFLALAFLLALGIHGPNAVLEWGRRFWQLLQTMPPWIFFLAMALICVLPVPISPFYLAAGPLYGTTTSLLWIAVAVALNQLIAYTLAAGILRPVIESQLERRGYAIPTVQKKEDQWLFAFLIRAVPVLPYAIQNWTLGLAGIERKLYLAISWPIQMVHATAWIVAGRSAFEGRYGILIGALSAIVALSLLGRWIGIRVRRTREAE